MRNINGETWKSSFGPVEVETGPRHYFAIEVAAFEPVKVYGLRGGEKVLLKIGEEFTFKARLRGFEAVRLEPTGDLDFGYSVTERPVQDGEPINHDNPPAPPLPGSNDNFLLQVRRAMRMEQQRNRPPVLEPEDIPLATKYEVDEEDERFEEEVIRDARLRQRDREKASADDVAEPRSGSERGREGDHAEEEVEAAEE